MSSAPLWQADATTLLSWYSAGQTSPTEVARAVIERIEQANPLVNALTHFEPEDVLTRARELEGQGSGPSPERPLHGIPFTVKDLVAVEGKPLTFGWPSWKDNIADHTDLVIQRLLDAGAMIVGHTTTSEGGYAGVSRNGLFGETSNPWRQGMQAGGSSGGAAAAVGMGFGPMANGSDGAGSVRIPASLCGVVGFKPSRGTIPLDSPYWTPVATQGTLARSVTDARLMAAVCSGFSAVDPFSTGRQIGMTRVLAEEGIPQLRVAVVRDFGLCAVDDAVWSRVQDVARRLAEVGCHVEEVSVDWSGAEEAMWEAQWLPMYAQGARSVDWPVISRDLEPELCELVEQALHQDPVRLADAQIFCRMLLCRYAAMMEQWDVVVSPVTATTAFPVSRFAPAHLDGEQLRTRLLGWLLTYPFNVFGAPAISLPAGLSEEGLPIGVHIAARPGDDERVFDLATKLESLLPRLESWNHATR